MSLIYLLFDSGRPTSFRLSNRKVSGVKQGKQCVCLPKRLFDDLRLC
jgi:hypothetical protein